MRFFSDSDLEIPVIWYRARPDAKVLPFYNLFSSRNWDSAKGGVQTGVGEVIGASRPWNPGLAPPIFDGQNFCGPEGYFRDGAPTGTPGNIPVAWQVSVTGCACSIPSLTIFPVFNVIADVCLCSEIISVLYIGYKYDVGACSCSEITSDMYLDYKYDIVLCACSEIDIGVVLSWNYYDATVCACSDVDTSSPWPVYQVCACSDVDTSSPWPVYQICACSDVSVTHVP